MAKAKKILALAMTVMMVVALAPVMPRLTDKALAGTYVAELNGTGYGTIQAAINAAASGQTVKLIANTKECITIEEDDSITLDLNGFVLEPANTGTPVDNKGELTVMDSNPNAEHKYVVASDGRWAWNDNAIGTAKDFDALTARPNVNDIITVKGGSITNGQCCGIYNDSADVQEAPSLTICGGNIIGNSDSMGAGIYCTASDTIMTGGRIVGNVATGNGGGGVGINSENATFTLSDGLIAYNTASEGGGVTTAGIFIMTGGQIFRNAATSQTYGYGGGIDEWSKSYGGKTTLTGGTISENTASMAGGGVYLWNDGSYIGDLYLGGTIKILDNTVSGNANNVYLPSDITLTIGNGTEAGKNGVTAPESGMSVGVTTEAVPQEGTPVAVSGENDAKYSSYFKSDNASYYAINAGTSSKQKVVLSTENQDQIQEQEPEQEPEKEPEKVIPVKTSFVAKCVAAKKSIKYSWSKVEGAKYYVVYFSQCGKNSKCKKVKTTSATSFTKKNLKKKTSYKLYVVAYDKNGKKLTKTFVAHIMTKGGKYSNATKVTAKKALSLNVGKVANVKAKIAKKDSKKKLVNHAKALRYYSTNKSIATVDAKGNVKAKKAGTVYIYSVAASGVSTVTKVTVETVAEPL